MPELNQAPPTPDTILDNVLSNNSTVNSLGTGVSRVATKTITFTGASGLGLHGTATTCFTITGGVVVVQYICGRVTTNLTGASATLTLGTTQQTTRFIGTTTATGLVTTAELWLSTTPTAGSLAIPAADVNIATDENIICSSTHATEDVASGVLEIDVRWMPLTPGATLVAA